MTEPHSQAAPPDDYVNGTQLHRALRRSREWLRQAVKDGRIPPPARHGNEHLWPRSVIADYFAALPVGPARRGPVNAA